MNIPIILLVIANVATGSIRVLELFHVDFQLKVMNELNTIVIFIIAKEDRRGQDVQEQFFK